MIKFNCIWKYTRPGIKRPYFSTRCTIDQRRQWHPTPVLLPGKSHGWRSLVGCSPWGCEESDTTEQLHFHFSLSCIGEGMATHSNFLAWKIPGKGEHGRLPSRGSHRVRHDWSDLAAAAMQMCYCLPRSGAAAKRTNPTSKQLVILAYYIIIL